MGQRGGSHENEFWLFSNTKMNAKNRAKKADENNGVICLVSMFSYWVMVLKLSKKCIVCYIMLTSERNLNLLKLLTYMQMEFLITFFQKMIWVIGVSATVNKISAIKNKKGSWLSKNLTKFFDFKP